MCFSLSLSFSGPSEPSLIKRRAMCQKEKRTKLMLSRVDEAGSPPSLLLLFLLHLYLPLSLWPGPTVITLLISRGKS